MVLIKSMVLIFDDAASTNINGLGDPITTQTVETESGHALDDLISIYATGTYGNLIVAPNGNYTYTPNLNNSSLIAAAQDGGGGPFQESIAYGIGDSHGLILT